MSGKELAYYCFLYIAVFSIVTITLLMTLDSTGIQVAAMFGAMFIMGSLVAGAIGILVTLFSPAEWPLSVMSLSTIGFVIVAVNEKEIPPIVVIAGVPLVDFLLFGFVAVIVVLSFRWGILRMYNRFLHRK